MGTKFVHAPSPGGEGDGLCAKNLAAGKTAPKGAEKFLATCIAHGDHINAGWQYDAAPLTNKIQRAAAPRALRLAVHGLVSAWHTGTTGKNAFGPHYLPLFMHEQSWTLMDVQ